MIKTDLHTHIYDAFDVVDSLGRPFRGFGQTRGLYSAYSLFDLYLTRNPEEIIANMRAQLFHEVETFGKSSRVIEQDRHIAPVIYVSKMLEAGKATRAK